MPHYRIAVRLVYRESAGSALLMADSPEEALERAKVTFKEPWATDCLELDLELSEFGTPKLHTRKPISQAEREIISDLTQSVTEALTREAAQEDEDDDTEEDWARYRKEEGLPSLDDDEVLEGTP